MRLPRMKMNDIKNSKPWKKFKKITRSNALASFTCKSIVSLIIWAVALIPTWIYLVVRWIAGPEGFWQELAVLVICGIVTGWLQVILVIGACFLTIAAIVDDKL